MNVRTLRLRALTAQWFTVLVGLLLVLAAVGAYGAYTAHVSPATTTTERVASEWSVEGGFDHSATVSRPNPVFEPGTELRNRSTYFTQVSPELDGAYTLSYSAGAAQNVTVGLESRLVLQSSGEETTYWTVSDPLGDRRATTVAPGDTVRLPFSVNVSAVSNRLARIDERLGAGPGETAVAVVVDVTLTGTVAGAPANVNFTRRLPITIAEGTFTVTPPETAPQTFSRTETVTVPREYGPLYTVGAPALLAVSLGAAAALVVGRRQGRLALDERERRYLDYRDDRREFAEWLARIRLPADAFDRPRAEADSLADLVDFAIDNDTGVVDAPDDDAYYVVGEAYLFVYRPPPTPDDARVGSSTPESEGSARGAPTSSACDDPDESAAGTE